MQLLYITVFTFLACYGMAAPTQKADAQKADTTNEVDPLIAAGKELPLDLDWKFCTITCDCARLADEDFETRFQCLTNPNCEECERRGMLPPRN
ncbi:hypothetical protein CkaCkLH20_10080 [Colletotrichum karsti]|uniref:Uncharacterized protein n=1 Tax=Colletotrichum karsti TaxID=1095194 RepID=A0A9P6HXC8_9PEZI|nr:uncharacterized protein CkaCkLH20_10080 [Colletotrichum karsti]KAF9872583.1 hypothetical protein CkaCkLH20_10080 [Colletotrichum karsti]